MIETLPYFGLALAAFGLNIPCGYFREGSPKFSTKWFLWIHASIPVIIFLRIFWHTSPLAIPVWIFLAVYGQIIGGKKRRAKMTVQEQEALQQIPPLLDAGSNPPGIADKDVMVTLLNMGGPRTNEEVPVFLKRIFLDPIILRFPLSMILQPFFAWMLVTFRQKGVRERYKLIGGASPIYDATQAQAQALKAELSRRGRAFDTAFSFNYSDPLPDQTIDEVKDAGKTHILPLSLYPHYSKATTGSNLHYLTKAAEARYPQVRFLSAVPYYLHDDYIAAFVDRIKEQAGEGESLNDFYLLFSAHGLPLYFLTEGDPYPFQIAQTTARILEKLGRRKKWALSYQSAVGPLQWLKPSTDDMLTALARRGIKKIVVVPVSFVTDHIETLCEIDIEYRHFAQNLGIEDFRMSKALECHPGFISALADAVEASLPRTPQDAREVPAEQHAAR